MKAIKTNVLNPLNSLMCRLCEECTDLLVQNAKCDNYMMIRNWFTDTVVYYGKSITTGYKTYLEISLDRFYIIIPECRNKSCCNDILTLLTDMIALLEQ